MSAPVFFVGPLDRVVLLKTLAPFTKLPPRALAILAWHARERRFAKGELLLQAGECPQAFYVIVEGRVAVTRDDGSTRQVEAGEPVGLLEATARSDSGLEARADLPTWTLELPWAAWLDVSEEHFSVLLEHLRYLATRNARALRRLSGEVWLTRGEDALRPSARPLDLVERLMILRQATAFSTGSIDGLSELAKAATELRAAAGQTIWTRGERSSTFLLVAAGAILRSDGERARHLHSGSALAIGVNEALIGAPRWNDAVAHTELVALSVEIETFLDTLEEHFDLAVDFLSATARRLLELRGLPGTAATDPR